jgi:iron complex outermembrane recepter protein
MVPDRRHVLSLALSLALSWLLMPRPVVASADSAAAGADSAAETNAQIEPRIEAQTETPEDGFGARIGEERIGLYGEDQVRGFALEDAGNYRIDGLYFVRTRAPSNAVLSGSGTRIGVNALRYDFPAASGIVDYALRTPEAEAPARTVFGWRGYSGPFIDHYFGAMGASHRWGFAGGIVIAPSQRYADGSAGDYFSVGLVPEWRTASGLRLRALVDAAQWEAQADTGYLAAAGARLPEIQRRRYNGQDWSRFRISDRNVGLLVDGMRWGDWRIEAGAFLSRSARERSDFNLYRSVWEDGTAEAVTFAVGPQSSRAGSGELRATRVFGTRDMRHRITAALRYRDSRARTATGTSVQIGAVDLFGDIPDVTEPEGLDIAPSSNDDVRHTTLALGYRFDLRDRLSLNFGTQRSRYTKALVADDSTSSRRRDHQWLYDASLLLPIGERLTLFAAAVRSLEETGAAPQNASNRNAILPPVLATQREAGMQWSITKDLTLIANVFDLRKALPGEDSAGVYRLIGDARHRGVELSLAGDISEQLDVNIGALLMQPRVDGGDDAEAGDEPVGRSARIAVTTLNWKPESMPGTFFDVVATYNGPRWVDRANTLRTPGYAVFDLGLRRDLRIAGLDANLRLRLRNVGDRYAWFATPSGLQFYNRERAIDARIEVKW